MTDEIFLDDPAADSVATGAKHSAGNSEARKETIPDSETNEEKPKTEGADDQETDPDDSPQSDDDNESGDDSTDDDKGKKPGGVRKRINELTREKHEARREAAERAAEAEQLRRQLESLSRGQQPTVDPNAPKEPSLEQFQYDQDKYQQAMRTYAHDLAQYESNRRWNEFERNTKSRQQQAAQSEKVKTFARREYSMLDTHPDYFEVAHRDDVKISDYMAATILEMEDGPKVAYYLGQHPEDAERISGMTEYAAAAELGRIAAKASSPPQKKQTNAPPPPAEVGSSNKVNRSPEKMSYEEYRAYRMKHSGS